ncbi:MAG: HNH nuclease family protein [Magnetococcales bacterium]|nr:HNH nuclease family protein [Magnetococcales bacterium]
MKSRSFGPLKPKRSTNSESSLDKIVQSARNLSEERQEGYRQRALKLYPWVCGRCARVFDRDNLYELTVHHRDHNHDNNPNDGSNWELLCLYCHDDEHARYTDFRADGSSDSTEDTDPPATHNPFANLQALLNGSSNKSD